MIEIAFRCRPSECFADRKVIGIAQGEGDRGWQDKSRKVRPVGRFEDGSNFNEISNIAKIQRTLPFSPTRGGNTTFDTL
jgi:hypothetical protein